MSGEPCFDFLVATLSVIVAILFKLAGKGSAIAYVGTLYKLNVMSMISKPSVELVEG